jgi:hypothetical protein
VAKESGDMPAKDKTFAVKDGDILNLLFNT